MRIRVLLLWSLLLTLLLGGPGFGAVISNPDQFFFMNKYTELKIRDFEYVKVGAANNFIDVGDVFRGILSVVSSNTPGGSFPDRFSDGSFELTGLFELAVIAIPAGPTPGFVTPPAGPGDGVADFWRIDFGPTAAFKAEIEAINGAAIAGSPMIALFNDTTPDFNPSAKVGGVPDIAASEATAKDGALYQVLGAPAGGVWGTNYYWGSYGDLDLLSALATTSAFAASLDLLVNNSGIASAYFLPIVTQTPPVGSLPTGSPVAPFLAEAFPAALGTIANEYGIKGSVKKNVVFPGDSAFPFASEDPVTAFATPEPASVALWIGLAVIGGAFYRRRKIS